MASALWKIGLAAAAASGLAAMPAGAAPAGGRDRVRYVDSNGMAWRLYETVNGAALRSRGIRIYFGRTCGAFSPQLGHGQWRWANGGVLFTFARRRIGFPRQDPPFGGTPAPPCRM
jgi:hypothetical protein